MLEFRWTDQHSLRAGHVAISRFAALGLKMSASSRLPASVTRIDRAAKRPFVDVVVDSDFSYRVAEAHRTILEFYAISTALHAIPGAWEERLNIAVGGHTLPEEDTSSKARDSQFELLVLALIHHAGFLDVEVGEPDIRVKAGDKYVGIAAKRITSARKIRKRLSDATKQIQRQYDSGVEFGIIALNLDSAVSSVHRHFGAARARAEFGNMSRASEQFVQTRPSRPRVPGVQTFATIFGWRPAGSVMALSVEFLTHSRWTSHESEVIRIGSFLRARGLHLQDELLRLLANV